MEAVKNLSIKAIEKAITEHSSDHFVINQHRADFFTRNPETPGSDYGENDEAIINDPKWQKISEYAKLVYEELSGDDLDEWEAQRQKR